MAKLEKMLPNQTLLLAEPIFNNPDVDESKVTKFKGPLGMEPRIVQLATQKPTGQKIAETLAEEYFSIASALKEMGVPFRIIVAHRKKIDERAVLAMLQYLEVRGLALHESTSSTCFPRDMMVDFDGKSYINPEANFNFPDKSGIISPLGEGGRVLKLDQKVFVPDPKGFVQTRPKYNEDLRGLRQQHFEFGYLPHPLATEIDTISITKATFTNDHLDRVASFIKGKDGKDCLLLDSYYVKESTAPYGDYWKAIKEACERLNVTPVVIDRKPESIPYALNLEQFADGTILATGGDNDLYGFLKQIAGTDKVYTTGQPIIFYPLYRMGGIRCMLLHAPSKIIGKPVTAGRV